MRTRGVVGKRIARVEQRRFYNRLRGRWDVDVTAIVLEDGTRLVPVVVETEWRDSYGYAVHVHVDGPPKG